MTGYSSILKTTGNEPFRVVRHFVASGEWMRSRVYSTVVSDLVSRSQRTAVFVNLFEATISGDDGVWATGIVPAFEMDRGILR